MSSARAVLFDFDGTLVDNRAGREAVARTCADIAESVDVGAAEILQSNRQVWSEYWPTVEADWALGVLDGETVSTEGWRRTLRALGRDSEPLVLQVRAVHRE